MIERSCPDPPRRGHRCGWIEPEAALSRHQPGRVVVGEDEHPDEDILLALLDRGACVTAVLHRPPDRGLLARLGELDRLEVYEAGWDPSVPWTLRLDVVPGQDDDLAALEGAVERAAARGATHLLAGLAREAAQQELGRQKEYQHRLFGLMRNLCDMHGLTFAVAGWRVPGADLNRYLASCTCCRWGAPRRAREIGSSR